MIDEWISCNLPFYARTPENFVLDSKKFISAEKKFEDEWTTLFDQMYPQIVENFGKSKNWNDDALELYVFDTLNYFWTKIFLPQNLKAQKYIKKIKRAIEQEENVFNQAEKEKCQQYQSFCGQKLNKPGTLLKL